MNKSVINKASLLTDFIEYALIFTVIVECNSLFHFSENYRHTSAEVILTLLAIGMAFLLFLIYSGAYKTQLIKDLKKNWPLFAGLLVFMLAFFALNVIRIGADTAVRKFALNIILFFSLMLFLFRLHRIAGRPNELLYKYANLMCVLTICNLIVYLCVTFRGDIAQTNIVLTRWDGLRHLNTRYNYFNICNIVSNEFRSLGGLALHPDRGFFTEQLMFCIPLTTSLFIEMFLRPKRERRAWKWLVFLLALIASQATLGWMLAALACGVKAFELGVKKKNKVAIILMLAAMGAAVLVVAYLFIKKASTSISSTDAHIEHYVASLKTFLQHPIIGAGYLNEEAILDNMSNERRIINIGLSNSIAVVFGEGGLMLGLFCLLPFFIPLLRPKSRADWSAALWILGPLALYCVTIFIFHLVLMLFMAYGYASLELCPRESRKLPKLTVVHVPEIETEKQKPNNRQIIIRAVFAAAACVATVLLFTSGNFWRLLTGWLTSNQLLLGQSVWKVYFSSLFLIFAVLAIGNWAKYAESGKKRTVGLCVFLVYTAIFCLAYHTVFSIVSTALYSITFFGDLIETAAIAAIYFCGAAACGLIAEWAFERRKKLFTITAVSVIATAGIVVAVCFMSARKAPNAESFAEDLSRAMSAADGALYADDMPAAFRSEIPELSYTGARDDGFAVFEKASVIAGHDRKLFDLFEAGFEVTELSEEFILYSNDEKVIEELREQGYDFYRYYPFDLDIESGPVEYLQSGVYTLTAKLRSETDSESTDEPVCTLLVTAYDGASRLTEKLLRTGDFDETGYCEVSVRIPGNRENVECFIINEEGASVKTESVTLAETPDYITRRTYNGLHLVLYEAYFEVSGEPRYTSAGYAAIEREYDWRGYLTKERYLDSDNSPILTKSGYAELRREYNLKGEQTKVSYFDTEGLPCLNNYAFSSQVMQYDSVGNVFSIRYLGTDGEPVAATYGYCEEQRSFSARRQITEYRYYDETGERTLRPQGYWRCEIDYDSAGNRSDFRYYGLDEELTMTTMNYAELKREFNDRRQIVREAYFGADGKPIELPGGAASMSVEYNEDHSIKERHYYDLTGAEINS